MSQYILIRRRKISDGLILTGDVGAGQITAGKIANTSLQTAKVPAGNLTLPKIGILSPANVEVNTLYGVEVDVLTSLGVGGALDYDIFVAPFNCRIVDVRVIPTAAHGGGTLQLQDAGTNNITDAMACAVVGTKARAATIDDAFFNLVTGAHVHAITNHNDVAGLVYMTLWKV